LFTEPVFVFVRNMIDELNRERVPGVKPERFFILGCQRSGTTLVRLILETHPDVLCYDELKAYAILQQAVFEPLPPVRLVGFKIPRWTEQLTAPLLLDEGLEGACENFYRGEKILFLYRDVRDTVASMLNLRVGEVSWCEMWPERIVAAKLACDATFRSRYAAEIGIVESCHNRLVGVATLYWKYKTDAFFTYREMGFPVLDICYERLVNRPRPVLEAVCNHLGIVFHDNLLRHREGAHSELFEDGTTVGNTDPRKPIHRDSVARWKLFLSDEDVRLVERMAGDTPARLATLCGSGTPCSDLCGQG